MPIRITCPSCSATLSVKDEFAGRAVKCPKCGGVIPPAPPAAPSAPAEPPAASASPPPAPVAEKPPETEPEEPAFEELDEPAKPAKTGGKITGKPVTRAKGADDDEDRPRRKDGGDDGDRPRRKDRDAADRDERDDRPGRRRRREEDDDRPARGKKEGGSGGVLIVGIICGTLLLCCTGVAGLGYWFYTKAKEAVETVKEGLEKTNLRVNETTFRGLTVGSTTRTQAENTLGGGKIATAEDIEKALGADAAAADKWMSMVVRNRAVVWRNGDDFILAAFHPNADGTARLQMKEWRPKIGLSASAGEPNDAAFLEKYPPGKPVGPGPGGGNDEEPPPGPLTEVTAEDLAQEYKDNESTADAKYKGKWLLVEGKVKQMDPGGKTDSPGVQLDGVKAGKFDLLVRCFCPPDEAGKVLNLTRGQAVTVQGKCVGNPAKTFVRLDHCRVKSFEKDPAIQTSAADLVAEFAKDFEAANEKYKDKEVFVTDAVVVSAGKGGSLARFRGDAGGAITLQANFASDQNDKLAKLRPGEKVRFKARAGLLFGTAPNKYVSFYDAYLVPDRP
jgi:predicted Zn finger-like uncharacterized protein